MNLSFLFEMHSTHRRFRPDNALACAVCAVGDKATLNRFQLEVLERAGFIVTVTHNTGRGVVSVPLAEVPRG